MAFEGYTKVPQGVYMTINLAVIDDLLKKYKTPLTSLHRHAEWFPNWFPCWDGGPTRRREHCA